MKASLTEEIERLQRVLIAKRVNINNNVLYKAFMLPDDCLQGPVTSAGTALEMRNGADDGRRYPTPAYGLMP